MEKMDKAEIVRRLDEVITNVKMMGETEIEHNVTIAGFEIQFDHYCWSQLAKVKTKITMVKSEIKK